MTTKKSASVSEMHRKTNFVADNIAASRQQQQLSASQQPPIASQQQANQIDPHMINQIHEGVKGFRLEMANALRAVRGVLNLNKIIKKLFENKHEF